MQLRFAGDADYGEVVVLAVLLGGFGDVPGGGAAAQQGLDAGKSEKHALLVLGFGDSVGQHHEYVVGAHLYTGLLVGGALDEAQRHRSAECDFSSIQIRRRVASVGDSQASVLFDAHGEAGGKASVGAAAEAAVQLFKDDGGLLSEAADGAQHADDHGDDHGGAQAFSAYVANDDERAPALQRDDLKEIAAYFGSGAVDALEDVAVDGRQVFRDHDALDFAGGGHFAFERGFFKLRAEMAAALADGDVDEANVAEGDGDDNGAAVECEAVVQMAGLGGVELMELRRVWEPVTEHRHDDHLQGEQGQKRYPEFAAQHYSRCGVADGEQAGDDDRDGKPQWRLAAHVDDVVGEAEAGEHEEDGQQKNDDGPAGRGFPGALVFHC